MERRMKMKMRWLLAILLAHVFANVGLAADPGITVQARQRYPWNGLVDVHFTITGDAGTKYDTSFTAKDMVGNTNITMKTIRKEDGSAANVAKEQLLPGTYNWVWDAAADLPKDWKCDRATVTGTAVAHKYLYMVVDLSSGSSSSKYPVSYLDAVPSGGWGDTYKTTKLVLRRCEAGSFKMGGSYNVTLTKPFYIGIFEVTQKQYKSIMGSTVGQVGGDKLPAEYVSYNTLRGSTNGAKWPTSTNVDGSSFFGKLRNRTGLNFDLSTEAQWEYACRAGTTSSFNNGGNAESDMKKLGRYNNNVSDSNGTFGLELYTIVGSYLPNAWGVYDMHGNVWEWVLDFYGNLSSSTDPKGAKSGKRVVRGGSWSRGVNQCTSSYRNSMPDYYQFSDDGPWGSNDGNGFRVCLPLSN